MAYTYGHICICKYECLCHNILGQTGQTQRTGCCHHHSQLPSQTVSIAATVPTTFLLLEHARGKKLGFHSQVKIDLNRHDWSPSYSQTQLVQPNYLNHSLFFFLSLSYSLSLSLSPYAYRHGISFLHLTIHMGQMDRSTK